eukprot:gene16156-biopygen2224
MKVQLSNYGLGDPSRSCLASSWRVGISTLRTERGRDKEQVVQRLMWCGKLAPGLAQMPVSVDSSLHRRGLRTTVPARRWDVADGRATIRVCWRAELAAAAFGCTDRLDRPENNGVGPGVGRFGGIPSTGSVNNNTLLPPDITLHAQTMEITRFQGESPAQVNGEKDITRPGERRHLVQGERNKVFPALRCPVEHPEPPQWGECTAFLDGRIPAAVPNALPGHQKKWRRRPLVHHRDPWCPLVSALRILRARLAGSCAGVYVENIRGSCQNRPRIPPPPPYHHLAHQLPPRSPPDRNGTDPVPAWTGRGTL